MTIFNKILKAEKRHLHSTLLIHKETFDDTTIGSNCLDYFYEFLTFYLFDLLLKHKTVKSNVSE